MTMVLAACGGDATPTPDSRIEEVLERLTQLEDRLKGLENATASPTESPPDQDQAPSDGSPTPSLNPTPTPNPSNSLWVHQRLNAIMQLYDVTDEGAALLRSLDLRQMRGDPGFFGSFGFKEWAGVGEAKPQGIMHEISHSYWGAFPISGLPDLSWETPAGRELSPAMEQYHADILTFMSLPPDDHELFRQRLRNLPKLSDDNREPLFHSLEAGMVYSTGGSLSLVPPILRKYWDRFLNDGQFDSWYQAVSWFRSLGDERGSEASRFGATKYLGFEHLDLRDYDSLTDANFDGILVPAEVLATEERQRLFDLADQFDLLLGEAQKEEQFQFWRGYLRDKVELQARHQDYLSSLELPRASSLASALNFLNSLDSLSHQDQADRVEAALATEPFLVNFLPVLDNRTLLILFASDTPLPQGETLQATASFVDRLGRFSGLVAGVLETGRADGQEGAKELIRFLEETGLEPEEDLRLFFDLLREEDPGAARRVVLALDKETLRQLMKPVPTQLRFTLREDDLLAKLDITVDSSMSDLKRGVNLLLEEPSGNFIIDEPFLTAMYQVIATRSAADPSGTLEVLRETPFPLEGFIQHQPTAASALLENDLSAAVEILGQTDPVVSPPARNVYRMIQEDPVLAARLVAELDAAGQRALAVESVAYPAYDKVRLEWVPGLPISLEQDGKYLAALAGQMGEVGLESLLREAFTTYGDRASSGQVADDFLAQYRATLEAAAATLSPSASRDSLMGIISAAAS